MNRRSVTRIPVLAGVLLTALPAHAAEGGLEIFPDWRVGILIAFFVLLILPVNALLFRPLLRVLDERHARIEGARERATSLARRADEVLAQYESAVSEARESAEQDRRGRLDEARRDQTRATAAARAEAERELARARSEVEAALAQARDQLRREAEPLARAAAAQVLGRSLS